MPRSPASAKNGTLQSPSDFAVVGRGHPCDRDRRFGPPPLKRSNDDDDDDDDDDKGLNYCRRNLDDCFALCL